MNAAPSDALACSTPDPVHGRGIPNGASKQKSLRFVVTMRGMETE